MNEQYFIRDAQFVAHLLPRALRAARGKEIMNDLDRAIDRE